MEYISLKDPIRSYSFKEVVKQGLASDGSLFVPKTIPQFDISFIARQHSFHLQESAYALLSSFVGEDLSESQLRDVIRHTFHFELPIVQLKGGDIYVEELFHGPTHAFKDVGARFLAGCFTQWRKENEKITVLAATSGDTGGAVANAFYDLEGINVIVLYPKGKISAYQEHQMAGLGKNIKAIALRGNFDDCQRLVKQAFADPSLTGQVHLTSANSINIGRWLPQMMFYASAWHYMEKMNLEKTIAVPSGNYGNISAGLLFHNMGFCFENSIAAHNENDTIPRFLASNQYRPHPTQATYANAMDVSDPSNFVRFEYIRNKGQEKPVHFSATSVTDEEILSAIRDCWEKHHYLLDPHSATAYHVLKSKGGQGTLLATAHPYKFKEIIIKALGHYPEEWKLEEPEGEVSSIEMDGHYENLKKILIQPQR